MKGELTVDNDINVTTNFQTVIGLAALIDLLREKGILTEAEYEKKFEESKKIIMDAVIEEMKKNFGSD